MNRATVLNILAQHAGQPLTAQVGRQIADALCGPSAPTDVSQFRPLGEGEYVIQAEPLGFVLGELRPLHEAHWKETEKWRAGIPLNANYPAMLERERLGRLLQVTLRHHGALVGHVRMFINTSLHTQTLYGDEDTLYITPEHRGGFMVMKMMRYVEKALLALGVREIRANSKLINSADVLMRRLGYEPVALQFCKVFEEKSHEPAA